MNVDPEKSQTYVSHAEFSEFKDADARWKQSFDRKFDQFASAFTDYRTNQSKEENWKSMLPVLSILIVIGTLVATPLYRDILRNEDAISGEPEARHREILELEERIRREMTLQDQLKAQESQ